MLLLVLVMVVVFFFSCSISLLIFKNQRNDWYMIQKYIKTAHNNMDSGHTHAQAQDELECRLTQTQIKDEMIFCVLSFFLSFEFLHKQRGIINSAKRTKYVY